MNWAEEARSFDCEGRPLVGILSRPDEPRGTAVVVIVGGPQYRAGSHRQFVLLARSLAAEGYPVLRFDVSGMGDSVGGRPSSFEALHDDIAAAVDELMRAVAGVQRVVLWGLCDGASAALLYVERTRDARICGLCLANPWARSELTLARVQVKHYYRQRLLERSFWVKLLSGRVAAGALMTFFGGVRTALGHKSSRSSAALSRKCGSATFLDPHGGRPASAGLGALSPYQDRMADGWNRFEGPLLLLLSGRDLTAKEFLEHSRSNPRWRGSLSRANVLRRDLPESDHTFSDSAARRQAEGFTLDWLRRLEH